MNHSPSEIRQKRIADLPFQTAGGQSGLHRGTIASIREIWAYRELLRLLISRELRAKYKNSSLGVVWSLVRPLIQLVIYYVAIGHFLGAARSIPDFAIFVYTGLTIWGLFSEMMSATTVSIVANGGIVKKVYLPREIFPLAAVGGALFNFVIQLAILLIATVVLGMAPLSPNLLLAPLAIAIVIIYGLALGLMLSATNVYLRDVEHFVEVFLLIFFWASPIVYSYTLVHNVLNSNWVETLYLCNPITQAVLGMQKAIWISGAESQNQYWPPQLWLTMSITALVGLILLWAGQRLFTRLQSNFAQEV